MQSHLGLGGVRSALSLPRDPSADSRALGLGGYVFMLLQKSRENTSKILWNHLHCLSFSTALFGRTQSGLHWLSRSGLLGRSGVDAERGSPSSPFVLFLSFLYYSTAREIVARWIPSWLCITWVGDVRIEISVPRFQDYEIPVFGRKNVHC